MGENEEKKELLMELEKTGSILFTELSAVLSQEQLETFARSAIERAVDNCDQRSRRRLRNSLPSEIIGMLRDAVEKSNHYQIKSSDDGMTFSIEEDSRKVSDSISQEINIETTDLVGMSKALIRIDKDFEEFCDGGGFIYNRSPEQQVKLARANERVKAVEGEITPESDTWEFEALAKSIIKAELGIDLDKKRPEKSGFDEI